MSMFCYQCQETAMGTGCTLKGVCGKTSEVANLQDLLLFVVRGIAVYNEHLRKDGHPSEQADKLIGGVLKYGIPEFRLPNKIVDVEIDNLGKMGVNFIKDCIVGKTIGVEDLKAEGFKGIFVASGAGLPNFMNIPGENSINIMSSNEYLTRVN